MIQSNNRTFAMKCTKAKMASEMRLRSDRPKQSILGALANPEIL